MCRWAGRAEWPSRLESLEEWVARENGGDAVSKIPWRRGVKKQNKKTQKTHNCKSCELSLFNVLLKVVAGGASFSVLGNWSKRSREEPE